jgi:hypothetical protein
MALNAGLDVSFDKMQDWKGIREKVGEVTKQYTSLFLHITNDEISC